MANRPVVLGSVFTRTKRGGGGAIPAKSGFAIAGDAPSPYLGHLSGVLAPRPMLMESAAGIGFMNWQPDSDRIIRRVPLLLDVNGEPQPSIVIESLRVAQGASNYLVKSSNASGDSGFGVSAIKVGDIVIPTQPAADIRVYFAKSDERRSVPAWKAFAQGRRPFRSCRQDRHCRRQRLAAFRRHRDPTQRLDAGRRGACAIDRTNPCRRSLAPARLGARGGSAHGRRSHIGPGRRNAHRAGHLERIAGGDSRRRHGVGELARFRPPWRVA